MSGSRFVHRFAVLALVVPTAVVAVGVYAASPAAAGPCTTRTANDVDGDGLSDVLIGQPLRSVGTAKGAVNLIRGSSGGGLTTSLNQYITDSSLGLAPLASDEVFGTYAAIGFFDAGCNADAVIGVTDSGDGSVGAIIAVSGSGAGLNLATAQRFTAAQIGPGANEFGSVLAVADFNHDGYDDVAIGAYGTNSEAGGVGVLYGSSTGLTLMGHQWFTQDSTGVPGTATAQNQFGRSLAAGDFNHDGYADLAIGVPGAGVTRSVGAGAVIILPGSGNGLTGANSTIFDEDTDGVPGVAEDNDGFGFAVAAGDVTGDGYPDLMVGAISEVDHGAFGAVFLLRGSSSGITATLSQYRDQSSTGFPASPILSGYGSTLAVADFNHDGFADIASGAGATVVNGHSSAGAFAVLYGMASGLSTTGSAVFTEDTAGMPGVPEGGDDLGIGLRALPMTTSGYAGLIVPAPGESSSNATTNGGIEVLQSGINGIRTTGAVYLDGSNLAGGIANGAEMGDDQPVPPEAG